MSERTTLPLSEDFDETGRGNINPVSVFNYIYAVLYSSSFRQRYARWLTRDYARIPIPGNAKVFQRLAQLGRYLIGVHVNVREAKPVSRFDVRGTNVIDRVQWVQGPNDRGEIRINREQSFTDIPDIAWELHIGGYRVLERWLKHRQARGLTYDEISEFRFVVGAAVQTDRAMRTIDRCIKLEGGWPI